jgi:hypothetical protein
MEQFDNFEDFFREEFEDFESETSPESWSRIREQLHTKRKRRFLVFWWLPVGIALLGLGIWWKPNTSATAIIQNEVKQKTENTDNQSIVENAKDKNNASAKSETIVKSNPNQQTITILDDSKININNENIINPLSQKAKTNKQKTSNNAINETTKSSATTIIPSINPIPQNTNIETAIAITPQTSLSQKRQQIELLSLIEILKIRALDIAEQNDVQIPRVTTTKVTIKEPLNKQKQHIQFVATAGLSSNYRNISPIADDKNYLTSVKVPSLAAINRMGWQTAIGVQIPIWKHWGVRTSLNYQGYVAQLQYDLSKPQIDEIQGRVAAGGSTFVIAEYPKVPIKENDIYHSLNLQGDFMYFFNKKNALSVGAGIGRLFGANPQQTLYLNTSFKHQFARFSAEPFFQYHLNNYQAKNKYYNFQPYTIGVNFGLK